MASPEKPQPKSGHSSEEDGEAVKVKRERLTELREERRPLSVEGQDWGVAISS